jgi:hypothetical protein
LATVYSGYGKALSEEQWKQMIRNVSKLKTELDRVQLEFRDDGNQQEKVDLKGENGMPLETSLNEIRDVSPSFGGCDPDKRMVDGDDLSDRESGSKDFNPGAEGDLQNGSGNHEGQGKTVRFDLSIEDSGPKE